jgi:hypothetical protein
MLVLAIATAPVIRTSRIRALTAGTDSPPETPPVAGAAAE